jgi:D-alanyl-D-alanine carboxypeptidase (penicillin-binding protein 5/6)
VAALESVVKVTPGERMTERQALQALMIASADNVAQILARWDAGGASSFTAKMNATAASLGMSSTRYTDPSGLDPGTVSTATDQVKLARRAIEVPTLAEIAAEPSAVIPVAGKIKNYNSLLGIDGVVGLKTGSDRAAGGCLLFVAREPVAGRTVTVLGAVLSQPGTRATFLPNVLSAADRLIRAVPTAIRSVPVVRAHTAIATQPGPHGVPITLGVARSVTMPGWPGAGFRLRLVAGRGHPRLQVTDIATGTVRIVQLVPLRS